MRPIIHIAVAAILVACGVSAGHNLWPPQAYTTWLYYSVENGEPVAAIKPGGGAIFKRGYDRKEESRKFAQMAKQWMHRDVVPLCSDVHYRGFGQLPCPECGYAPPAIPRIEKHI